jgi:cell division protein FtsQ
MKAIAATSPQKLHWSFWFGVAFFIAVIVGIIAFSLYLTEKMVAQEQLPITSLSVDGEMRYTKQEEITKALEKIDLSNFFKVDVNAVQQQIAKLPWVYSVAVRKQWPNELKIYLVDQKPIALWNGDFLINQYGDVFQANTQKIAKNIPQFFGPEGSESIALENFKNFNRLLKFKALSISELVLTERFSWQITLSDGVVLNLGRENRIERIQRFMDIYPEILKHKKVNQQVNYVDLRYDTGVAVGWKTIETAPLANILLKTEQNINV